MSHLSHAQSLAAGLRATPSAAGAFAATQAAWRFYSNEAVTLPMLAGPLVERARAGVAGSCDRYALVALDWSGLHYSGHDSKRERVVLRHARDLGYDLLTALALSDRGGEPLAPLCLELRCGGGVHTTRCVSPATGVSHLSGLGAVMGHVEGLGLCKPAVFVIDREGDSVAHYREWVSAGRLFVVRANDARRVTHEGVGRKLIEVAAGVELRESGRVTARGEPAVRWVGEARVTLRRPARTHRVRVKDGVKRKVHHNVAGEPVELRLVVSAVRGDGGQLLSRWLLLRSVDESASAAEVALWYHWRWEIESYHKLLKGAGMQLENWRQEDAGALARRLAVASMAAVVVWELARDPRPEAARMRGVLVRLSGRQMRRGAGTRGFTEPALLAGLGVLLPMLCLLERHGVEELLELARRTLPYTPAPPRRRGSG